MPVKTICDTMIWYYLGNGKINFSDHKSDRLTATFINVYEVATTHNLLNIVTDVKNAIRSMIKQSEVTLFDPPLIHLARIANPDFAYDTMKVNQTFFDATAMIANGHEIDEKLKDPFKTWLDQKEKPLDGFADHINTTLDKIKAKIVDKKKHALEDASTGNRQLINFMVNKATDGKYNLDKLDWKRVELFDKTTGSFFKELELSNMRFQKNDLFDWMNLVYVEPGDKYFTKENRWINRIKNAQQYGYLR